MILWRATNQEPQEVGKLNRKEVRNMIIQYACDYAANQKALSILNSQEKADLNQEQDSKRKARAAKKLKQLKLEIIDSRDYQVSSQDIRKAVEDIYREHQDLIGRQREDYLNWLGDEESLLELAKNPNLENLDLSDEV